MAELDTPTTGNESKRDQLGKLQRGQLRPLANRRPELYDEDEYTSADYERMMELYNGTLASIDEGEIVKSRVREIRDNMVVLDIGFKSEGAVPLEEFKDHPDLKPGDEVEVLIEHLEDQEGAVVLSKKTADFMRVWEKIRLAYENDRPVEGALVKKIKGGVVVDLMGFGAFIDLGGVDGLLHITDMSWGRIQHPSEMFQIGQEVDVKVLDIDWTRERISLGYKQLQPYPWKDVMEKYPVGTRVTGKVVSITNYGAFIEIEPGIEGLVHISDMSWTKRVQHPSEVVKKGDTVDVVILNIDADNKRISLGLKQAEEDPWLRIGETYPVGTELRGKVVRLMDKGVVVDVGNDIEGFVPVSQLNMGKVVTDPAEITWEGMKMDVRVLEVDPIHRRIVLAVTNIPEDQPPRPETPSKVIPMDSEIDPGYPLP